MRVRVFVCAVGEGYTENGEKPRKIDGRPAVIATATGKGGRV